jgi:hypothetical protein
MKHHCLFLNLFLIRMIKEKGANMEKQKETQIKRNFVFVSFEHIMVIYFDIQLLCALSKIMLFNLFVFGSCSVWLCVVS